MLWEGDLDTEVVYNAPNVATAEVVKSLLAGEGIPSIIVPFASDYSGHPAMMPVDGEGGWGLIVVKSDHAAMSRKIIDAYEAAPITDEEFEAQAEAAGEPEVENL